MDGKRADRGPRTGEGLGGCVLTLKPSVRGAARSPVRELRDPAVFVEAGRTYLLYAVAGNQALRLRRCMAVEQEQLGAAA
jgi:hypothetical protein